MPKSATTETETTDVTKLDEHIADYLRDDPGITLYGLEATVRAAIESGWHAARAVVAEELRDLIDEARAEVAKRMPFPILPRLDAIVTRLEDELSQ